MKETKNTSKAKAAKATKKEDYTKNAMFKEVNDAQKQAVILCRKMRVNAWITDIQGLENEIASYETEMKERKHENKVRLYELKKSYERTVKSLADVDKKHPNYDELKEEADKKIKNEKKWYEADVDTENDGLKSMVKHSEDMIKTLNENIDEIGEKIVKISTGEIKILKEKVEAMTKELLKK